MSVDISISERNLNRIHLALDSGIYASTDDVINAAMALLEWLDPDVEREWADMRESVKIGLGELDAGLGIPADEVFNEILQQSTKVAHEEQ